MVFDDDRLGVGSANIDPRSSKLNTELFMIISSEKLTKEKKKQLDRVINMENLYQLSWGQYPKEFDDEMIRYGPIWHTMEEGKEKIYYTPPHTGFWKRLGTDILKLFPIRGYL
jgi:putative cardiolipin synthase